MALLHEFLHHWERACDRQDLPKLLAEVRVTEAARSQAARLGREFLFACALGPWETDDVLSEIALLTLTSDSDETWRLRRLSAPKPLSTPVSGYLPTSRSPSCSPPGSDNQPLPSLAAPASPPSRSTDL